MAAIRFKWTVRREDNGEYYVDETIGENAAPVVSGPLAAGCRDQAGGRSRERGAAAI